MVKNSGVRYVTKGALEGVLGTVVLRGHWVSYLWVLRLVVTAI